MVNEPKRKVGLLILSWLVALTFVMTGASKLAAVPPSPENFARWGLSPNFMLAIGAVEVLAGLALLIPRAAKFAAVVLIGVMLGALRTGVIYHESLHIFLPLALLILLAFILYRRVRA